MRRKVITGIQSGGISVLVSKHYSSVSQTWLDKFVATITLVDVQLVLHSVGEQVIKKSLYGVLVLADGLQTFSVCVFVSVQYKVMTFLK